MYRQNYNGGQETGGYQPQNQPAAGKQKKEEINKVQLTGYIVPRSSNENDKIQFYPFKNGGGAVHCNIKVIQYTGQADENGQPRYKTTYVPLDINVNKVISAATLQGLVSGMKVRVVGELRLQSYEQKTTREKKTSLVVAVYILEVLQMPMHVQAFQPMQPAYQPMPGQPQAPVYQQQYQQNMGGMPNAAPQGGYVGQPQPQMPGYQQPQQQAQAQPVMGGMPGMAPQGGYPQPNNYPPQGQYQQFVDDGDLPQA